MLEEYIHNLKAHDWFFDYSDDHRVWQTGQKERNVLEKTQQQLDPDYKIWNQHCPINFKRGLPSPAHDGMMNGKQEKDEADEKGS